MVDYENTMNAIKLELKRIKVNEWFLPALTVLSIYTGG